MHQSIRRIANNEDGYTFMESLFQLAVYALFAQFFIVLMLWAGKYDTTVLMKEQTEWELFMNDFLNYISRGQQVETINNGKGIRIHIADQQVSIEKYNQMIRKQVNGLGHEPMLMNINNVHFLLQHNQLSVSVEFAGGLKKEREIIVPVLKE